MSARLRFAVTRTSGLIRTAQCGFIDGEAVAFARNAQPSGFTD
jgi:hypothetical protein